MEYTLRFEVETHWYRDQSSSETIGWTFNAASDEEALKSVSEFFRRRRELGYLPRVLYILDLRVIRKVNIPPDLLVKMKDSGQVSIA